MIVSRQPTDRPSVILLTACMTDTERFLQNLRVMAATQRIPFARREGPGRLSLAQRKTPAWVQAKR